MNNPLFSIIVPVYNVEPYIATCIESIYTYFLSRKKLFINYELL